MIQNILILDDSSFQRKYIHNMLDMNYSTFEASEENEAMDILNEAKIDLIIVDNILKNTNGYEFTRKIREAPPNIENIPVIMNSAMDKPVDIHLGFEMGVNAYVVKPVKKEKLLDTIYDLEVDDKAKRKDTCLVIDDSTMIRKIIRRAMEAKGVTVHEAKNGQLGMEMAIELKPDIITCDLEMPKMNGFEAVAEMRKVKELAKTPVFIITTRIEDHFKAKSQELNVTHYFTKPFDPKELTRYILNCLDPAYSEPFSQ